MSREFVFTRFSGFLVKGQFHHCIVVFQLIDYIDNWFILAQYQALDYEFT